MLKLVRTDFLPLTTLGELYLYGQKLCFILEDTYRPDEAKVYGKTCIPEGTYPIALRTEGEFHARYSKRFFGLHKGMVHFLNVPNFKYILFHIGNTHEDSQGCLLSGTSPTYHAKEHTLLHSKKAYEETYPQIVDYIEKSENPQIQVTSIQHLLVS